MASKASHVEQVRRRIVSVREAEPHVKVLLYGRNGHGKTRIGGTAPKLLVVDVNEKGTQSIRNQPGVDVIHCRTWEDVVYAYWFLQSGDHEYESVLIDTLTGLQNACIQHVLKEAADRDTIRDPKVMTIRDWGKLKDVMGPQLLNFRNLPMNVIFTAQMRSTDNDEGETEKVPDLSAGVRGIATACVGIIGYVFTKEVRVVRKGTKKETKSWQTCMLVGPHEVYTTKDRTNALGRIVRNPTIPLMIEAVKNNPMEDE